MHTADDVILMGSRASSLRGLDLGHSKDVDILCTRKAFQRIVENNLDQIREVIPTKKGMTVIIQRATHFVEILEAEIVEKHPTSRLVFEELMKNADPYINYAWEYELPAWKIATLNDLYMLKESHKYLKNSPHFLKTRSDIMKMRQHGCTIVDYGVFLARQEQTYDYSHPKLNQDKKSFFTDEVDYVYDHDSIHEAMKHYERPAYTYYAVEGEEVLSSKEKFFAQFDPLRQMGVLEEAYVLALERSVIPYDTDPDKAFEMALMKICTSITSGWFREYAWENYDSVMMSYKWDWNYVERFKIALHSGNIKPFKEKS